MLATSGPVPAGPGWVRRERVPQLVGQVAPYTPTSSTPAVRPGSRRIEDRVEVDGGDVATADHGDPETPGSRPQAQRKRSEGPVVGVMVRVGLSDEFQGVGLSGHGAPQSAEDQHIPLREWSPAARRQVG